MIKNRKGQQGTLQIIVNNFFYIMMLILAVVILMNSMHNMEYSYKFRMTNMKFNNYVARAMYSDNCFAYEETYTGELGERTRVYPATIDVSKLSAGRLNDHCLVGLDEKDDYEIAVAELSDVAITSNTTDQGSTSSGGNVTGAATGNANDSDANTTAGAGETCTSKGYNCINETEAICSGTRISSFDSSCSDGFVCCTESVEEIYPDITVGKTYYSTRKSGGEHDYNEACKAKVLTKSSWFGLKKKEVKKPWDRVATFFVDIQDGAETKRGILKFCFEEAEGGWEKGKTRTV